MRLTSDMFISALTRRIFNDGGHAVIGHKGTEQAGAIYIRNIHRNGMESLYAPAPQAFIVEESAGYDRTFELRLEHVSAYEIDEFLGKEKQFDPDIWVVDIETDRPEIYLNLVS